MHPYLPLHPCPCPALYCAVQVTKERLRGAMEGHVLAEACLVGHYSREKWPGRLHPEIMDPRVKERDLWEGHKG